jgi:uncharacterized membrane protein
VRPPRSEHGSVTVVVAISLSVIVVCTALTVDLGRISTLRRDLQNVADAAALDLVRLVDGRTRDEIVVDPEWDATLAVSLERNGVDPTGTAEVTVRLGDHDPVTGTFVAAPDGATIPTAVSVTVRDRVDFAFAPGGATATRAATAAQTASAGLRLGSFAARLDSSRSVLLDRLLDGALRVDLVGYSGLAGVTLGLDDLATELDLSLGSPEELLATELDVSELVAAQAAALRRNGALAAATLLETFALTIPASTPTIVLGDVISLGSGGAAAAAVAQLDVLELLTTTALVANGDRAIAIPGLTLGVPGVAATTVTAHVVESPRIAFGGPGTTVRTSQIGLDARLDLSALGLVGARLDVHVAAAPSVATIDRVTCGEPMVLGTRVTTGLVEVGATLDTRVAVDLLGLVGATVATAGATAGAGRPTTAQRVDFALPPDALGVAKTTSSGSLGLGDLTLTPKLELLPSAQLPVLLRTVLGLVTSTATGVVSTVLAPLVAGALTALDAVLVQPLLALLGVTLPGADVTPLAIRCTGPDLVA